MLDFFAHPLVEPSWSAAHLADGDLCVVDARGLADGTSRELYRQGHLPGAFHLDWHMRRASGTGRMACWSCWVSPSLRCRQDEAWAKPNHCREEFQLYEVPVPTRAWQLAALSLTALPMLRQAP
jgi:hypothetical protein